MPYRHRPLKSEKVGVEIPLLDSDVFKKSEHSKKTHLVSYRLFLHGGFPDPLAFFIFINAYSLN